MSCRKSRSVFLFLLVTTTISSSAFGQSFHAEELVAAKASSAISDYHYCSSFQFNAEVKNLINGWLVPGECVNHVKRYILKGQYAADLQGVISQARDYAKDLKNLTHPKKTWVFDIDETSLSNIPYYKNHSFGATKYNPTEFNAWVNQASAPVLAATLALFNELVHANWKVMFITGRPESQREVTVKNLAAAGYKGWKKLILKNSSLPASSAQAYKSRMREGLVEEGYEIWGNIGDQWSDISGTAVGNRVFKLPNPLYFIP